MLTKSTISEFFNEPGHSRRDCVLLVLAVDIETPKSTALIRTIARGAGLLDIDSWDVSSILSKANEYTVRVRNGWVLIVKGKSRVTSLTGRNMSGHGAIKVMHDLRKLVEGLSNKDTISFLDEALTCFENGCYRATVVLSWIGAVAIIYDYVIKNKLSDFNVEAIRRDPRWRAAINTDDLARMKEKEFLDILVSISILGKSTKHELEICLDLRNGCGHPNSLSIGENRAASHLESLILNVYSKF